MYYAYQHIIWLFEVNFAYLTLDSPKVLFHRCQTLVQNMFIRANYQIYAIEQRWVRKLPTWVQTTRRTKENCVFSRLTPKAKEDGMDI